MKQEKLLTVKEIATILSVSVSTVVRHICSEPGVIITGSPKHRTRLVPQKVFDKWVYDHSNH
jgi:hypothetical protein